MNRNENTTEFDAIVVGPEVGEHRNDREPDHHNGNDRTDRVADNQVDELTEQAAPISRPDPAGATVKGDRPQRRG